MYTCEYMVVNLECVLGDFFFNSQNEFIQSYKLYYIKLGSIAGTKIITLQRLSFICFLGECGHWP